MATHPFQVLIPTHRDRKFQLIGGNARRSPNLEVENKIITCSVTLHRSPRRNGRDICEYITWERRTLKLEVPNTGNTVMDQVWIAPVFTSAVVDNSNHGEDALTKRFTLGM